MHPLLIGFIAIYGTLNMLTFWVGGIAYLNDNDFDFSTDHFAFFFPLQNALNIYVYDNFNVFGNIIITALIYIVFLPIQILTIVIVSIIHLFRVIGIGFYKLFRKRND